MKNHLRNFPDIYKKPQRDLEISGEALPRWTPPYGYMLPEGEDTRPVLIPLSLEGHEAIGELYRYVVRCRTDIEVPSYPDRITLDLDSIVGTQVTVSINIPGKGTHIAGMPGDTGKGNIGFGIRRISGSVTRAEFVRRDDRAMIYDFVLEPALAEAAKGSNYRTFQNETVIEVIKTLLAPYPLIIDWRIGGPLLLDGGYPRRDLIRQYFEPDLTCFQRLCQHWGLFYWFEHREDYHRIVIADTPGAFHPHGPAYETLRFATGNRIDEEHIDRLEFASQQTVGHVTAVDHDITRPRLARVNIALRETSSNPRNTARADQEVYTYANVSQPLQGAMGLGGRPNDVDNEARFAALVRQQSLRCEGLRAKGHGNLRGLMPGSSFHLIEHPFAKANQEYLVVRTRLSIEASDQSSGTGQAFRCETEFDIQPIREYFRMPFTTPWPVAGVERAIVTGPEGHEIWTDALGRVKCQLVPDRQGQFDLNSFIWVQPVQSWQNGRMGSAAVPRIGSAILIGYVNGNPDMPFIHGSQTDAKNLPAWELPHNQWLSGMRSRMQGGFSSNHLALDDTKGQQQAQLASDHGKSGLSVGFNTRIDGNQGRQDARGEGFELRTDLWGVLRAAKGLLATTFARWNAAGKVKDMDETVQRLTQAREQHEEMSQLAQQHKAQDGVTNQRDATQAIKTQNDALKGGVANPGENPFPEMSRPDLVLASAAGVAMTATDSTHIASVNDHAVTAGRDYSVSVGRSYHASVRGAISLFAYQDGMRFYAAKGKVELQAQGDAMALAALKDITITSTSDRIIINAANEVWIGAGGSFIQINAQGIVNGTTGTILEKCASWDRPGPASMTMPMQALPIPEAERGFSNLVQLTDAGLFDQSLYHAWSNLGYSVTDKAGNILDAGALDGSAVGMRFFTREAQDVDVWVGTSGWDVAEEIQEDEEQPA